MIEHQEPALLSLLSLNPDKFIIALLHADVPMRGLVVLGGARGADPRCWIDGPTSHAAFEHR